MTTPTTRAYVSPISILSALITALLLIASTSCADDNGTFPGDQPAAGTGISISLTAGSMLPQVVTSRAEVEDKTDEEKRINTVHLFFFDADGNFLTPTDPAKFAPYMRYDFTGGRPQLIAIPAYAFEGQADLTGVKIVALANLFGTSFRTEWTPDGDILYGDPDDPTREVTVSSLADLRSWLYRPQLRDDVTRLPAPGMPMVGETLTAPSLAGNETIDIHLTALMARVDVEIGLDADQTNTDGTLPALTVTRYGIINLPCIVPLFIDDADSYVTRTDGDGEILTEETVDAENVTKIFDKGSKTGFTYYTYENVRQPAKESFQYPDGVADDPAVKQRWKPCLADAHASALVIYGDYITHQGLGYGARFKFYLGSNTVDNFEVRRNRCYKNNITIRGLDYVRNTDEDVYTFDARVNVTTDNPLYISIVNERRIDAHWAVVPMDIYFLDNDAEANVEVEILYPEQTPWIRMELVPADIMEANNFTAGTGAREYFTENLIEELDASANGKSLTVNQTTHKSRSRVYFYVDENTDVDSPEYGDRKAHIKIKYSDKTGFAREQQLEFEQRGLKHVTGENIKDYISGGSMQQYTNLDCWVEYYEEYEYHRDPLDLHQMPGSVFPGLTFGFTNTQLGSAFAWDKNFRIQNRTGNGKWITDWLLNHQSDRIGDVRDMKIYNSIAPANIFIYCLGKNKRKNDGSIDISNYHWYVPAINEIEQALILYYNDPTFNGGIDQNYWSSTPGEKPLVREDESAAKHCSISSNGSFTESKSNRSTIYKIRAFYKK